MGNALLRLDVKRANKMQCSQWVALDCLSVKVEPLIFKKTGVSLENMWAALFSIASF